jgi:transposase
MSLRPQPPLPPVPGDTARIARAAFRRGNPYVLLRDRLGAVFADADFAGLYPALGQPAYAPWRLALVTLVQFREALSDRQAADAVRGRIDWKYLPAPELGDPGFDHSVLCEFRGRLLRHGAIERLPARLLEAAREDGLFRPRGRQRTDSTHVLAAVRDLNRLELLGETMRATLNAIAVAAPGWPRAVAPPEWHERYDRRVEDMRLPDAGPKRDAYAVQVGRDGFRLLDALDGAGVPAGVRDLPAVAVLRRVWARHFGRVTAGPGDDDTAGGQAGGRVRLRPAQGRGPGDRVESPYGTEARFRSKAGTDWTGYVARFTETCDADAPRLIVHADTTPADVHEAMRTGPIHDAPAAKGLAPSEHLADAGYVGAGHIVTARERHRIDLVGPARPDQSWQAQEEGAFRAAGFAVDWERRRVRCPEGRESATWGEYEDRASGQSYIRVGSSAAACRPCPSRSRCTRAAGRRLGLPPRPEHEAIAAARARLETEAGRRLHRQRRGVEGTLPQGVRAFGLRRARYRGLAKTALQHVATAAAINLDRIAAWLDGRPLAPTRTSRFAALAA